jgi:hypothetical protein
MRNGSARRPLLTAALVCHHHLATARVVYDCQATRRPREALPRLTTNYKRAASPNTARASSEAQNGRRAMARCGIPAFSAPPSVASQYSLLSSGP